MQAFLQCQKGGRWWKGGLGAKPGCIALHIHFNYTLKKQINKYLSKYPDYIITKNIPTNIKNVSNNTPNIQIPQIYQTNTSNLYNSIPNTGPRKLLNIGWTVATLDAI